MRSSGVETASVGVPEDVVRRVGFIGLGDQGLPMARAVADSGYELHVWARRPATMDALGDVAHVRRDSVAALGATSDLVALCVSTDEDVLRIVSHDLLDGMRAGSVLVNHGTGIPRNAIRLGHMCADRGVDAIDAPVSGGRPGAEARTLTVLVGGDEVVARRCEPVFRTFAQHIVHAGGVGAGQLAKLFNNALLMMNQASIADIVELGRRAGLDPFALVEGLQLGSATSAALTLLNTMVNPDTVEHLSRVEALDMRLFQEAMTDAGIEASQATARGLSGADRLPELIRQLNQ